MEGLSRSYWRDAPPTHFKFRIESFSTFSTSWSERFKSSVFRAGEYNWKLALYPNGNSLKYGEDHLSLYLLLAKDSRAKLENEILVSFTLLLFDHVRERYYSVQDISRLDRDKSEVGFDKFMPLKSFIDPSNGYLVNDSCMLGADIFFIETTPKEQCLSMIPSKPAPYKYTWKVEKFSELEDKEYYSGKFTTRGHDWRLTLYPSGSGSGKNNSLSLFLELADSETFSNEGGQVLAEYTLRLVDQFFNTHKQITHTDCFCASMKGWGCAKFLPLSDLNDSTAGYLVKDTCIIEAEVLVLGSTKRLG